MVFCELSAVQTHKRPDLSSYTLLLPLERRRSPAFIRPYIQIHLKVQPGLNNNNYKAPFCSVILAPERKLDREKDFLIRRQTRKRNSHAAVSVYVYICIIVAHVLKPLKVDSYII